MRKEQESISLMKQFIRGEYINKDGENIAGIQESICEAELNFFWSTGSIWILNVLFYYLLNERVLISLLKNWNHIYSNSQKLVMESIALVCNANGNQLFLTTHSQYILGTINNLLYADKVSRKCNKRIESDYQ